MHFKIHKTACKAYVLADTRQAQQDREVKKAIETDMCLICLEPPRMPTRLPCGHSFCTECMSELRKKGVSETCPACRAPLPMSAEKLFELGNRVWLKFHCALTSGGGNDAEGLDSWPPLSASQLEEMDGAIVMLQEAMDQVLSNTLVLLK